MKTYILRLLAMIFIAVAPGLLYAADCTIKVGAVLPTSVDWGRPIAETAKMAVDIFNKAGGVKNCQVDLILRDTRLLAQVSKLSKSGQHIIDK